MSDFSHFILSFLFYSFLYLPLFIKSFSQTMLTYSENIIFKRVCVCCKVFCQWGSNSQIGLVQCYAASVHIKHSRVWANINLGEKEKHTKCGEGNNHLHIHITGIASSAKPNRPQFGFCSLIHIPEGGSRPSNQRTFYNRNRNSQVHR